jgi:hypothetical protein
MQVTQIDPPFTISRYANLPTTKNEDERKQTWERIFLLRHHQFVMCRFWDWSWHEGRVLLIWRISGYIRCLCRTVWCPQLFFSESIYRLCTGRMSKVSNAAGRTTSISVHVLSRHASQTAFSGLKWSNAVDPLTDDCWGESAFLLWECLRWFGLQLPVM